MLVKKHNEDVEMLNKLAKILGFERKASAELKRDIWSFEQVAIKVFDWVPAGQTLEAKIQSYVDKKFYEMNKVKAKEEPYKTYLPEVKKVGRPTKNAKKTK